MWSWIYLYSAAFSFLLSLLLVYGVRKLSLKFKILDDPGPRKIQTQSVPLLGGLGILLAFFLTLLFNMIFLKMLSRVSFSEKFLPHELLTYVSNIFRISHRLLAIFLGGLIVFIVGLIDDFKDLGSWPKLMVQMLAASILFFAGVRITFFSPNLALSFFLTILWVVAITNAFNLLDNMDGLSAGVAFIATCFLLCISISENQYFVSVFLCVFAGSILGFLIFNFHPAKIFMGDAGSYFIGFLMSSVTILGTYYYKGESSFAVFMPVLILGLPIYDLCSVILIRTYEGRSIFQGDRQHFSHRLMALGMTQKGAVLFLYLITFVFGLSALLMGMVGKQGISLILLQAFTFAACVGLLEYFGRKKMN